MKNTDRRTFIKQSAMVGLGTTFLMSSSNVWGFAPNETVNVAIIGTGGRSYALMEAISFCKNIKLAFACDVDSTRLNEFLGKAETKLGYKVKGEKDFRKLLESKKVDAIIGGYSRALACANGHHGHAGGQACICGKTV